MSHANVAICNISPRRDLESCSCVNRAIQDTNEKIKHICSRYSFEKVIDVFNSSRDFFTRHGLYTDSKGKNKMQQQHHQQQQLKHQQQTHLPQNIQQLPQQQQLHSTCTSSCSIFNHNNYYSNRQLQLQQQQEIQICQYLLRQQHQQQLIQQ
ncbi:hypothetical protein PR048_007940 [Dryococelus australis]|uniref:Uncharacterized protein n=1 Tax=Dryococelus australis TaxID=614101 RepID=A0ABQ9HVP6_9NEOP|nr:hypothetical protein PR048_007940 [Dryococelus australis]